MQLGLDGATVPAFPHVVSSTAKLPLPQDLAVSEEDQEPLDSLMKSSLTWSFLSVGSCKNCSAPLLGPDCRVP